MVVGNDKTATLSHYFHLATRKHLILKLEAFICKQMIVKKPITLNLLPSKFFIFHQCQNEFMNEYFVSNIIMCCVKSIKTGHPLQFITIFSKGICPRVKLSLKPCRKY